MRPNFQTAVLSIPLTGRIVMPLELDFTTDTVVDVDLETELMDPGGISFVQCAFIDNGARGDTLTLQFFTPANQGFTLRIPGRTQTWQPLLLPAGSCRFRATSVAGAVGLNKVQIGLGNFPVQPILWNVP